MSSGDDNDGITADDGRTTDKKIVTSKYHALPRELVLHSGLTSNYPAVGHSTAWHVMMFLVSNIILILYIIWLDLNQYIIWNIFNVFWFHTVQNSRKWLDFSVKNN